MPDDSVPNNARNFSLELIHSFIRAFTQQGGTPDLLQALVDRKARMIRAIAVAQGGEIPTSFMLAAHILGEDFISPFDVAKAYRVQYSEEQIATFVAALPNEEILSELHVSSHND